ncbi:SRPBCC family protein [Gordonia sp. CPCC 205333]|uniref:SRPBCC family protein n=1 Tax=Gordonia sp. CPCC 205333 TaxID=3140790 RepID=UPI003AF3D811
MPRSIVLARSTILPRPPAEVFTPTLVLPLPALFSTWFGPIPPIREVLDQTDDWQHAGQTRTIKLSGGGQMTERLTEVNEPARFRYQLSDVKGAMAPLASSIDGEWRFESSNAGTTVTWQWEIHAKSVVSGWILPAFGKLWNGYADRALKRLGSLVA